MSPVTAPKPCASAFPLPGRVCSTTRTRASSDSATPDGVVARVPVDDDDLVDVVGDQLEDVRQVLRLVLRRHDDRDARRALPGRRPVETFVFMLWLDRVQPAFTYRHLASLESVGPRPRLGHHHTVGGSIGQDALNGLKRNGEAPPQFAARAADLWLRKYQEFGRFVWGPARAPAPCAPSGGRRRARGRRFHLCARRRNTEARPRSRARRRDRLRLDAHDGGERGRSRRRTCALDRRPRRADRRDRRAPRPRAPPAEGVDGRRPPRLAHDRAPQRVGRPGGPSRRARVSSSGAPPRSVT